MPQILERRCNRSGYSNPRKADYSFALDRASNRGWHHQKTYDAANQFADLLTRRKETSTLADRFKQLAAKWRDETIFSSSIQSTVLNAHYQSIIGMGPAVVPFIFEELKTNGGHWYWALQSILGQNPAAQSSTVKEAKARWLQFAVENDYLDS